MVETGSLEVLEIGLRPYSEVLNLQLETREKVQEENENDHLILCEHNHVYTFGKSAERNNLLINPSFLEKIGAEVFDTDRGGDITYHGPGQLVGYPIINLNRRKLGVRAYVELLEKCLIETLAECELDAFQIEGLTGIWIDSMGQKKKIGAIGIRVSRGVTMHGFALNVSTDLSYFNHIVPCGISDKGVTSLKQEGIDLTVKEFAQIFTRKFDSLLNNPEQ
ncbi:lipoyl(octanoyl) transferase LipB [bacterium]|nr:lipoyl(octanoyl) transferase LipB [bacterium]